MIRSPAAKARARDHDRERQRRRRQDPVFRAAENVAAARRMRKVRGRRRRSDPLYWVRRLAEQAMSRAAHRLGLDGRKGRAVVVAILARRLRSPAGAFRVLSLDAALCERILATCPEIG